MTSITWFTPHLRLWIYWWGLPDNSVRLIDTFRPDIETFVKAYIAANDAWQASVELQTGRSKWTL